MYRLDWERRAGSGIWLLGVAGENLADRELVYLNAAGVWMLADADAAATMPVIGITLHAFGIGLYGQILIQGSLGDASWSWTVGGEIYASQTAGALTQAAPVLPAVGQQIGLAITSTIILFNTVSSSYMLGVAPAAHEWTHVLGGVDDIDSPLDARAIALTAHGDIVYLSGVANTLARLAPGAAGLALLTQGAGANPIWGAPTPAAHVLATTGPHTATLPLTDLEIAVQGELIHRGAVDWEALGVGVALQALISGGAGADVSWGAPTPAVHVLATTGPHSGTLPLTDLIVAAQGEVIHRGAVDWEALGVGVALQALISGGPGADVSWGAPTPAAHVLATTGPHSSTLPLTDLAVGVQGQIIHRGAVDWEVLAVGGAGLVLTAGGAGADVAWAASGGNLEPFYPVLNPDSRIGQHQGAQMLDGVSTIVGIEFLIPSDFNALVSIEAIVLQIADGASGNMVWTVATDFGITCTEDFDENEDTGGATTAITQNLLQCLDVSDAFTGIAAGDLVGFEFTRDGGNGSDTLAGTCYLLGIKLVYTV